MSLGVKFNRGISSGATQRYSSCSSLSRISPDATWASMNRMASRISGVFDCVSLAPRTSAIVRPDSTVTSRTVAASNVWRASTLPPGNSKVPATTIAHAPQLEPRATDRVVLLPIAT